MTPWTVQPARLLCPWYFLSKNTGGGCHFLLQGFFPTQESNTCLLHWQADFFYHWTTGKPIFVYIYIQMHSIYNVYIKYRYVVKIVCMYMCALLCLVTQLCPTFCDATDCSPPGSSVHGDSWGKNTEVGCHALLQGIFPTQGLNPDLLYCGFFTIWTTLLQGRPRILEWIVYAFPRGSSQPRNPTRASCIAGGFFTSWTTREALFSDSETHVPLDRKSEVVKVLLREIIPWLGLRHWN